MAKTANEDHTMSQIDIKQALFDASAQLKKNTESPELEAQILVAHTLGKPRSYLYSWPEKPLSDQHQKALQALVDERCTGKPIAYIVGHKEFWSLSLKVTPDVLIPRPATESIIEEVLQRLPNKKLAIADLGTGSGAIALAFAHERPNYKITAVDINQAALTVAAENAHSLGIKNIEFLLGDWCGALTNRYDAIVSNPPYIAKQDPHLSNTDIQFEPYTALASGEDGLAAIRQIAKDAKLKLVANGLLALEHGFEQQADVMKILTKQGYQNISGHRDSDGLPRFVVSYRD